MVENILSIILLIPVLGILLIWLARSPKFTREIAVSAAFAMLCLSLVVVFNFDSAQSGFQFVEKYRWIESINVHYQLGVDGLSVWFLPLVSLLFLLVILASWKQIHTMTKLYYTLLLLLLMATCGVFVALDSIMFMLFWELTLIPVYFLIALWGKGASRRYAATNYTMFMLVGGLLLLFGFTLLALQVGDSLTFDVIALLAAEIPHSTQLLVFFFLFIGFGFKAALVPFHTWLPVVAMEGPAAIGTIMTGLKIGIYGIMRFALPLAPDAALEFQWVIASLGVIGILYGSMLALQQTNIRAMLAYSSVTHIGLVMLALSTFTIEGYQGALMQLMNFVLISGGLFIITGFIYNRLASTELIHLGGLAVQLPLLTSFFFFFAVASLGMPGTSAFPAEFMMIMSALNHHMGSGLAALIGIVLAAVFFVRFYKQGFSGRPQNPAVKEAVDLHLRERIIVIILAVLVLIGGLYPSLVLDKTDASSQAIIERFSR